MKLLLVVLAIWLAGTTDSCNRQEHDYFIEGGMLCYEEVENQISMIHCEVLP